MDKKEVRKIWMKYAEEQKELLESRVKSDIEKYRKGWCKIKVTDNDGNPLSGRKVKITQKTHDFKYGANIFMLDEFTDEELNKKYREEFKNYFNLATIPFYWDALEPEKGKPRFDKNSPKIYRRPATELCAEYCEENNISAKLHCLVYEKFLPKWLDKGNMSSMEKAYEERVRAIAEMYSGRFVEFEVINEQLSSPCCADRSVVTDKRDVVKWAFELARKHLPYEKLVINEGGTVVDLSAQRYSSPYFMQIDNALKSGVKIDKIGLQNHIFTGAKAENEKEYEEEVMRGSIIQNPEKILDGLDMFAEFGLPLEITEITVPTFGTTDEDEQLQADLLELIYSVFFSHPMMDTIVYWNLPDGYAFQKENSNWRENNCRGGLFRNDMSPKASALRLKELFEQRWRTTEEAVTDEEGYVSFRGFYGDYELNAEGNTTEFSLKKNKNNIIQIIV